MTVIMWKGVIPCISQNRILISPLIYSVIVQDSGHKEMIRSHEMLRHSPTMSMLFDINGEMLQVQEKL